MRIGLDYLPAVCHAPGIGRYARELVRALVRLEHPPELALFEIGGGKRTMEAQLGLPGAPGHSGNPDSSGNSIRRRRSRLPRRFVRSLHRLTGWGAERWLGRIDLFQRCLVDYPPVNGVPEVMPVVELPPAGSAADLALGNAVARSAAALVFCEHYAREVPARYGINARRVHQVRVGCEHWERERNEPTDGATDNGHTPRLIALGAIRKERKPLALLRGFEALRSRRPARLVFVGAPGSAADELRHALAHSPARADVEWISAPVEADMPHLVAGAAALVHLAFEEGTPVTPLEAFAAGLPVVASPLPAFEEALGELGRFVADDEDPNDLSAALEEALEPRETAAADRRRALASNFTWDENARATLDVWRGIVGAQG